MVALFSFAVTLISSPLLLRTWRPSSFTRCHCVTTAATTRATVTNVTKRFTRAPPPFPTLPTGAPAPNVAKMRGWRYFREHSSVLKNPLVLVSDPRSRALNPGFVVFGLVLRCFVAVLDYRLVR